VEFMNRLLIVGSFWIISTAPLFAQAQQPDAAKLKVAAPHRGLTTSPQAVANACRPSMGRR
jgi:hypothetical protein